MERLRDVNEEQLEGEDLSSLQSSMQILSLIRTNGKHFQSVIGCDI